MSVDRLFEEVNDKELKYWEKNESFWRLMFSCSIGFVSFVTPFVLGDKVSVERQRWMSWSVVCGAVCAGFIVPILRRSIRLYRELWIKGRDMVNGHAPVGEVVPQERTVVESVLMWIVCMSAVGAGVFMVLALFGCSK